MKERFESFAALINKISRGIKRVKKQELSDHNLRGAHVSCLYYLYSADPLTSSDLCLRCEEDKATVSRTLDYLEKNGYVVRVAKETKQYKKLLTLTEKGIEAGKRIADKVNAVFDRMSECLSEEERRVLFYSLDKISTKLEAITAREARESLG